MCLHLQSSRFIDFNKQKISIRTLDKHRLNTDWEKADNCITLPEFLLHVFGKFPITQSAIRPVCKSDKNPTELNKINMIRFFSNTNFTELHKHKGRILQPFLGNVMLTFLGSSDVSGTDVNATGTLLKHLQSTAHLLSWEKCYKVVPQEQWPWVQGLVSFRVLHLYLKAVLMGLAHYKAL